MFPGHTIDVTTVAQVKDDLKGWQLSRCVFVRDAGMVSQENLDRFGKRNGKSILCMPMRLGMLRDRDISFVLSNEIKPGIGYHTRST